MEEQTMLADDISNPSRVKYIQEGPQNRPLGYTTNQFLYAG